MRDSAGVVLCCILVLLPGCRQATPDPMPGTERMEWQGLQGCADCDGIDTMLVLSRADGEQRFEMVETYLVRDTGEPFVDTGAWRFEAPLVRLQGDGGSVRIYAVLGDGRLQSRNVDGSPERGGHVLQPVGGFGP